jgi:hypothetical protein
MSDTEPTPTFGMVRATGQLVLYHQGDVNHCPTCGGAQWYVGRRVAECVTCNAAIPIVIPAESAFPIIETDAETMKEAA